MLPITIATLLSFAVPAHGPQPNYACNNGKSYHVRLEGGALQVKPANLPQRVLIAQPYTGMTGFSDGGLNLLLRDGVVMIGAPELEARCTQQ